MARVCVFAPRCRLVCEAFPGPARGRPAPLGSRCRRGHLRRLLRLECRFFRWRIRRGSSWPWASLPCSTSRASPRRPRLLLRADLDGSIRGIRHRPRRKYGIHLYAGYDRRGHRWLSPRDLRHGSEPGAPVLTAVLRDLCRTEYPGRGNHVPVLCLCNRLCAGGTGDFLRRGDPASRLESSRSRRWRVPAERIRGRAEGPTLGGPESGGRTRSGTASSTFTPTGCR